MLRKNQGTTHSHRIKITAYFIFCILWMAYGCTLWVNAASEAFWTPEEAAGDKTILTDNVVWDSIDYTEGFGGESGDNLFDYNVGTKFCTSVFPAEVSWEMDQAYVVDRILLATANDNAEYAGRNPYTYTISASNDNKDWTVLYSGTFEDLEDVNFMYYYVDVENTKAYVYYKFECPEPVNGSVMQISELVLCTSVSGVDKNKIDTTVADETADIASDQAPSETSGTENQEISGIGVAVMVVIFIVGGIVIARQIKLI